MESNEITISDISRLAEMSGLVFTDEEKQVLCAQVSGILEMLDGCANVDSEITEESKVTSLNDLRNDVVYSSLSINDVFTNAPRGHKGYFVVPKVVD